MLCIREQKAILAKKDLEVQKLYEATLGTFPSPIRPRPEQRKIQHYHKAISSPHIATP
jgi:restriction endonuclease S subunit